MGLSQYDERRAIAACTPITASNGYANVTLFAADTVDRRIDTLLATVAAAAAVIVNVSLDSGSIPVFSVTCEPNAPPDVTPTDLMAALRAGGVSDLIIPANMECGVSMAAELGAQEAVLVVALGGTL